MIPADTPTADPHEPTGASLHGALRRTTGPVVALRVLGQGGEFVAFVLLARRLGASEFGVTAVAYLACRYLGIVADWGAGIRGARDVAAGVAPTAVEGLVRWRHLTSAACALAYAGGAVALGRPGFAPLALCVVARGATRDWIAAGQGRGIAAGAPAAVQGTIALVGASFVGDPGDAVAVLCLATTAALATSVLLNPVVRTMGRPAERPDDSPRWRPDGWYLGVLLADQVYASADVVLLSVLRSAGEAGVYAAVYRFPNAWITIQGLVVTGIMAWTTSEVTRDPARIADLRRRGLVIGGLLAGGLLALTPLIVRLGPDLLGDDYAAGRTPLALLMVAAAVGAAGIAVQPLYFAIGSGRALAGWSALTAATNLALNLVLVPRWGMVGAALATIGAQLMVVGFLVVRTRRPAVGPLPPLPVDTTPEPARA